MRRQILDIEPGHNTTGCCPGHDNWPSETYRNRRSKRARARDKAIEHRFVRRKLNGELAKEIKDGI
jgi:hypothetical protein